MSEISSSAASFAVLMYRSSSARVAAFTFRFGSLESDLRLTTFVPSLFKGPPTGEIPSTRTSSSPRGPVFTAGVSNTTSSGTLNFVSPVWHLIAKSFFCVVESHLCDAKDAVGARGVGQRGTSRFTDVELARPCDCCWDVTGVVSTAAPFVALATGVTFWLSILSMPDFIAGSILVSTRSSGDGPSDCFRCASPSKTFLCKRRIFLRIMEYQ
mmetsp:Transcript_4841/g.8621  ORF Transcript_4841/g.8621 Transcript_4841/m.8621 type:complete len:212 (-) Transcript_4841:1856-2491(-)